MRIWLSRALMLDLESPDMKSDGLRIYVGGESGSGKSSCAASIAGQLIAQGGQVVCLDAHGEHGGLWALNPANVDRIGYGGEPVNVERLDEYLQLISDGRTVLFDLLLMSLREPTKMDEFVLKLMNGLLDIRVQRPSFTLLLVEEAHYFAPQAQTKGQNENVKVFVRIATGGRKWGLHSLFCTQRQSLVDVSVLASCNARIFLRTSDWRDWKKIRDFLPERLGITFDEYRSGIKNFQSGEAIVTCRWTQDARVKLRPPPIAPGSMQKRSSQL